MTGLIDFSVDPTTNGTGAAPINFAEGQPAGTVNNSARALMAALACWRDDNSGQLVANAVTGTALALGTAQGVKAATLKGGLTLAFRVSAANTGPVVINVDATGNKPVRRPGNLELAPGDLSPNIVYRTVYSDDIGAHLIVAPHFESPGKIAAFGSVAAIPPGWVRCDGTQVSRNTFKALFDAIGTAHGAGNGTTSFTLPDLDGRAVFGADNGKGRLTAAGGLTGALGDVGGSASTALSLAQMPSHGHTATAVSAGGVAAGVTGAGGAHDHGGATGSDGAHTHGGSAAAAGGHGHTGSAATGGSHSHNVQYTLTPKAVFSQADGNGNVVTAIGSGTSSGLTDTDGPHSHSLTVNAVADHTHALTINNAGAHTHPINSAPTHTHTTPAIPDHTHTVSITAAGEGQAHANMPPGLVAVYAIKA